MNHPAHKNESVNRIQTERLYRHVFTGKERDSETGFSYFGARYYDCDLSGLFLSVDPMADKYPSISPYAYCAWNPVRLVDPDGMKFDSASSYYVDLFRDRSLELISSNPYNAKEYQKALDELSKLEKSTQLYHIFENRASLYFNGETSYDILNNRVNISFDGNIDQLAHELVHAFQFETGFLSFSDNTGTSGVLYDLVDEREAYSRQTYYRPSFKMPSDQMIITLNPGLNKASDNLSVFSNDPNYEGFEFYQTLSSSKTYKPSQIHRIFGHTFCADKVLN